MIMHGRCAGLTPARWSDNLDDPSFPVTIYARLIEGEDGAHNLIWSRSKGD